MATRRRKAPPKAAPVGKVDVGRMKFFTDERGRRFHVIVSFGEIDGRYEVVEVTLRTAGVDAERNVVPLPWPGEYAGGAAPDVVDEQGNATWLDHAAVTPPFGLVADDLRSVVPWGGLFGDMRRGYADSLKTHGATDAQVDKWSGGDRTERLKAVAEVYRVAVLDGANPIDEVCRRLGIESKSTASKWVLRARRAGHLAPTTPGRARP